MNLDDYQPTTKGAAVRILRSAMGVSMISATLLPLLLLACVAWHMPCVSASTPSAHPTNPRSKADSSVDVIVIGSGWSGLSAVRSLLKQNYSVALFEARDRVGGRSLREQLKSKHDINAPLWIDEGGQWFGPDQTMALELLEELGIEKYLSYHGQGAVSTFWKQEVNYQPGACWDCMDFPTNETEESPEPLYEAVGNSAGELKAGMQELIGLMEVFSNLTSTVNVDEPWKTPNAAYLDSITFQEWVYGQTSNEFARSMMILAGSELGAIAEPWWASALHIARQQACSPQPMTPEKWLVKGAAGQVPPLLANAADKAGAKILLNSPVLVVQQNVTGVTVHSLKKATNAKAVIIAMPPHLTGRIEYQPPLSALRDQLVQRVFMGSIIKVIAVYKTPFWRDDPKTNMSFVFFPNSTGATEVAFDITAPEDVGGGGSGVLASFITRRSPLFLNASEAVVKAAVLKSFAQFFGPKALKPMSFVMKNWAQEPFTGGAYSSVMPLGAWTTFGSAWSAPAGNIFWAGTDVSNRWPGFYEGALNAAKDAVDGVTAHVKPTGVYTGKWPKYKPAKTLRRGFF